MDDRMVWLFVSEIRLQCVFILTARGRLERALKAPSAGGFEEIWLQLQIILAAAANISKILWGSGSARDAARREAERKPLRDRLGVADDSPLRDPDLRNDFEHFDERLERWLETNPDGNFIGRNVMPVRALDALPRAAGSSHHRFHHYDPETGEVTFWTHTVSIPAVVTEAERLWAYVQDSF